jgi:hypothetical protein
MFGREQVNMKLGILKLPDTVFIRDNNLFVIQQDDVTKQLQFGNLLFSLDNTTFANTISAHSTQIETISGDVIALSGQLDSNVQALTNQLNTSMSSAFKDLQYTMFPIGSVRYTSTLINPGSIIPDTTWQLVSQGQAIAGVTTYNGALSSPPDKNNDTITVLPGPNDDGEYGVPLAISELPAHTHEAAMIGETNASIAGLYVESQQGPEQFNIVPTDSSIVGESLAHNNLPPLFGVYTWVRTA